MNNATTRHSRCEHTGLCQMDHTCTNRWECASQVLAQHALAKARGIPQARDEAADEPLFTPDGASKLCLVVFCIALGVLVCAITLPLLWHFDAPLRAAWASAWAFVHQLGWAVMTINY